MLSSNSTGTSSVTSSRTCWRRRQLPRDKLATSYEEFSDTPDHHDMSRWSESRQLPRNFLVTSWRLPRNICYGEVTGKLVPVEFELHLLLYYTMRIFTHVTHPQCTHHRLHDVIAASLVTWRVTATTMSDYISLKSYIHIPGEPKKNPPYDFCWYYSNAWEFLYEILHDC